MLTVPDACEKVTVAACGCPCREKRLVFLHHSNFPLVWFVKPQNFSRERKGGGERDFKKAAESKVSLHSVNAKNHSDHYYVIILFF